MLASDFEFRHRTWFIFGIFCVGLACYSLDSQNSGEVLARSLRSHIALLQTLSLRSLVRALFLIATVIVAAGAVIRTWGEAYLRADVVHDSSVHTERLVADGPFRYTRNPLYFGLLVGVFGAAVLWSRTGWLVQMVLTIVFCYRLIFREEAELFRAQGENFLAYQGAVPRLVPALKPCVPASGAQPHWRESFAGQAVWWGFAAAQLAYAVTLRLSIAICVAAVGFGMHVARKRAKVEFVILAAMMCIVPEAVVAQSRTPRHEIVRSGLTTLQVTIRGQGEPVIFIPSRGRGAEDFDALSNSLVQARYQAILPEPRGIGGSTGPLKDITYHDLASDAAATIESVVGRPVTVIGHDFGNRIARTLASDYPRLVKQLILLSAAGMVPQSPEMEKLTTRFWETALSREERLTAIRQIFFARGNDLPATWGGGWYPEVAKAQRASDGRTPLKDWWAGGSVPMLVVQGTEDVVAVPENARRLAAEFPERVTLVEIPHAGHALLPEQPEQVEKAVLTYLRSRGGTR